MDVEFEYDNSKAKKNLEKHGITFSEAEQLWKIFSAETPACSDIEPRWLRIGKIREKFYTCIFTRRGQAIRIISLRRSWKKEEKFYYEEETKTTQKDHNGGI